MTCAGRRLNLKTLLCIIVIQVPLSPNVKKGTKGVMMAG